MGDSECRDSAASGDAAHGEKGPQAAVYARQSRASRSEFSSCDAQVVACHDLALSRGWRETEVFSDEGQSSETLDRPALGRLIGRIESGMIDRLVVYSIDRLTRKLFHLHELLELFRAHGVELAVVTDPGYCDSATSRLMTNIVAAASEFQQDLTRERMADMRGVLKRNGKRVAGRVPFGYRADPVTKKLLRHAVHSIIVRDFFELASKGARPSDLASLGNLKQWKDQNGETGKWTARRILKLLKNPTYVGEIRDGKSTLPGEHERIVKREVFDEVQRQLAARRTQTARAGNRRGQRNAYPAHLLGLLVCEQCDRPMSISVSHRGPIRYVYYRCRSHAGGRLPCRGVNVPAFEFERVVCHVLADADNARPEIPRELRQRWSQLEEFKRWSQLPSVVQSVRYHHATGEITIELKDDVE